MACKWGYAKKTETDGFFLPVPLSQEMWCERMIYNAL